jgi:hypothetical protein
MLYFTSSLVWKSWHAPQVKNCAKIGRPFSFLRPCFHTIWTKALMYNEQCVSVNRRKLFPAPLYRVRPDINCRIFYLPYMDNDTRQIWVTVSAAPPPAFARNGLTIRAVLCRLPDKIMSLHVKHEIGPSVNGYPRHVVPWEICLWGKIILVV